MFNPWIYFNPLFNPWIKIIPLFSNCQAILQSTDKMRQKVVCLSSKLAKNRVRLVKIVLFEEEKKNNSVF